MHGFSFHNSPLNVRKFRSFLELSVVRGRFFVPSLLMMGIAGYSLEFSSFVSDCILNINFVAVMTNQEKRKVTWKTPKILRTATSMEFLIVNFSIIFLNEIYRYGCTGGSIKTEQHR